MRRLTIDTWRRMESDDSGAIAILFALMLLPMLGLTLTAIDYGRAIRLESHLQQAVDSAAAAAVHKLGQDHDIVQAAARQHLDAALPEHLKGMEFAFEIAPKNKAVEIRVESSVPTTLIAMLGLEKFTVRASSTAFAERTLKRTRPVEIELPRGTDPNVARALDELARQSGVRDSSAQPSAEQQEEIRRAAEDADRMIRDALSRLGR